MSDQTRNRLILLAAIVAALLVCASAGVFLYLLLVGRASVPESVTSAIAVFIVGLLATGAVFINGQLSRRHSDTNAQQTQATVVKAAELTQAHVQQVASQVEQVQAAVASPVVTEQKNGGGS